MIKRIVYDPQAYHEPRACLASIGERLRHGWQVSAVEPAPNGSFRVVFRHDGPAPEEPPPVPPARDVEPRTGHGRLARLRQRTGRV